MNGIGVASRFSFRPLWQVFLTIGVLTLGPVSAGAQAKDQKIIAKYDISFNGLSIGDFRLESNFWKSSYDIKARANISIFGGLLFEWRGDTASSGRIVSNDP
ncbi:MAG: hypothetical protein KTR19_00360, partial [Hyphomicrobiales bacterium]|nr:hypothetical protein [Hyphomicrobiales bacterium]